MLRFSKHFKMVPVWLKQFMLPGLFRTRVESYCFPTWRCQRVLLILVIIFWACVYARACEWLMAVLSALVSNEAAHLLCSSGSPGYRPLQNDSREVYPIFIAFYVIFYWLLRVIADPLYLISNWCMYCKTLPFCLNLGLIFP